MTLSGLDGTYNLNTGFVVGSGSLTSNSSDPVTLTSVGTYGGVTQTYRATLTPLGGATQMFYGNSYGINYRACPWMGSAWGASASIGTVSPNAPQSLIAQQCPTRLETAVECQDSSNAISLFIETGSTWAAPVQISANSGDSADRAFDLAYMQTSGTLLAAYSEGSGPTVHYRTWDGTTLSADNSITFSGSGNLTFIRLIPSPSSNQIIMLLEETNKDVFAAVWNGSTWIKSKKLQATASMWNVEGFSAAWQTISGIALVAWVPASATSFQYCTWDGSSWGTPATSPTLLAQPDWPKMVADPASNSIIMGEQDVSQNIQVLVWNGSSWGTPLQIDGNATAANRRDFDVSYMPTGTNALVAWGHYPTANLLYRIWDGTKWKAAVTGPALDNTPSTVQLVQAPSLGQIFVTLNTYMSNELVAMAWNGSSMTSSTTISSSLAGNSWCYMPTVANSIGAGGYSVCRLEQP